MSSPVSRGVASRFGTPQLRVLLVAVVVSLGSLAFASSAFAGDVVSGGKVCPPAAESAGCGLGSSFDPNTTNVPYLGVAGEQIRVVKCGAFPEGAFPEFLSQPVDWSGDGFHQPQLVTSSVHTIFTENATCFAAEYISDKPGLAFIKLKIFAAGGGEITEHQFLVGWTRICGNTLTEVASPELGDPTGNGVFNARPDIAIASDPTRIVAFNGGFGRLRDQIKLCLPMGSNFAGLFPGDNVTLPDDWVAFANQFARDNTPSRADDPGRWDIHDTQDSTADVHVDNNTVNPTTGTATCDGPNADFVGPDTVDNCFAPNAFFGPGNGTIGPQADCNDRTRGFNPGVAGGEVGSFSRVFGDLTTCPTVGPFDPQRPDETLLSDGLLNAGDAPLPAVRIDFTIAPPSGTGIDGVGVLCGPGSFGSFTGSACTGVDKHVVHSRNNAGNLTAHNLDSPFYAAYIPATDAPDPRAAGALPSAASGVSGVHGANNFPAFLNDENPYHFWDHTFDLSNFPAGGNVSHCNRFIGERRTGPIGATTVSVYSDEHGESQSFYDPGGFAGSGFFFDRIPGVVINANGGCDLQNVRTLGTSSITAIARYPYEPVTLPDVASNAVTKTVNNLFNKSIACVNKGNVPDVARLCTVTAVDINGEPFGRVDRSGDLPDGNEIVCFSIQDGSSVAIERGFDTAPDPNHGTNRTCGVVDEFGHLQVIVLSSTGRPVDLIAHFTDEELFRDCFVDFTPGGAGNCIASGGTGGGTTPPPAGPTQGTTQTVVVPAHATSHAKFTVAYTRVVRPVHHRRYLQLRINGKSKKKVRIRIRITDRKGRSRTVTRTVRTNRAVRLYGLPLTGAKRVKVTVLG